MKYDVLSWLQDLYSATFSFLHVTFYCNFYQVGLLCKM